MKPKPDGMGNGNRNRNRNGCLVGVGGGDRDRDCGFKKAASLECDVGLGLKMLNTESHSPPPATSKMMPSPTTYHNPYQENNYNYLSGGTRGDYGGYGYNPGCGPQLACASASSIYDAPASSAVLSRTMLQSSSGGGMSSGKVLFTANQWQELERQTTIYKCMMTSTPVPPELLLPFSSSSSSSSTRPPQSNSLDLRFSTGSDPEPWRCRRTDGKKWRCSRDVAPDQKYCERHAHKSRPRSRKPVEIQSHTTPTTTTNTTTNLKNNNNPSIPRAYNTNQSFQKPTPQYSNMVSPTTYDHPSPRGSTSTSGAEWFTKSGGPPTPSSTSTQQFQQLMQSSSARLGGGVKRDKNSSVFEQNYEQQHSMSFNPYMSSNENTTATGAETTRIDGCWSRGGLNGNNYKCSLTLSMQSGGGNAIDDQENDEIFSSMGGSGSSNVGGEILKSQSHDQWSGAAWMGGGGGPLGEALCLGISTNNTSSEDGGVHPLNFIS